MGVKMNKGIALYDADSEHIKNKSFPNYALMKISELQLLGKVRKEEKRLENRFYLPKSEKFKNMNAGSE